MTLRRPSGKVRHRCPGNLAVKALRPAVRHACLKSLNAKRGRAKNQVTLGNQRRVIASARVAADLHVRAAAPVAWRSRADLVFLRYRVQGYLLPIHAHGKLVAAGHSLKLGTARGGLVRANVDDYDVQVGRDCGSSVASCRSCRQCCPSDPFWSPSLQGRPERLLHATRGCGRSHSTTPES